MIWHAENPTCAGFYWVLRAGEAELAYFTGSDWQVPETVGDREGLSAEYMTDVSAWTDLVAPKVES